MLGLPPTPPIHRNGKNFSGCVRDGSYFRLWDNRVIAVPTRSPTSDCFDESVVNNQSVATSTISSATSVNYSRAHAHPELSSLMSQYGIHQYGSFLPSLCPSSPMESKHVEGDGKLFRPASSLPPTPSSQQADEGIIFSSSFENLVRSYGIQEYASMLPPDAYLADEEPYSPQGEGMETDDEDCEIDVEAFSDEFDEFMSEVSGEDDDDDSDDQDSVTFFSSSPYEGSNICSNAPVQAAY